MVVNDGRRTAPSFRYGSGMKQIFGTPRALEVRGSEDGGMLSISIATDGPLPTGRALSIDLVMAAWDKTPLRTLFVKVGADRSTQTELRTHDDGQVRSLNGSEEGGVRAGVANIEIEIPSRLLNLPESASPLSVSATLTDEGGKAHTVSGPLFLDVSN